MGLLGYSSFKTIRKNNTHVCLFEEKTFNRIYEYLEKPDVDKFTLHQVSIELEITTVTIRKYLKHMEKLGYVRLQKEYGDVGRPKAIYHNLLKNKSV